MERFGQDLLLLEKLAAGGMAEVYRAKQLGYGGFEKTIAVKRILPHYAANEEFKAMFRLEANLSGLLQHPNIVQVFGNGEHEGYLYLVMEFVDGRNLRQILARADKTKTKIPIEIACYIITEAAKGLDYAHNFHDEKTGQPLEVVHRDMSPQNVMLSYDGGVKIVDFGIAKAAARADVTKAGVLKGKFGYMSPEQASGQKLDKRTDIFALGIILFEILTQRRLFTCEDDLRTLQLVRECRVPRPSRYNPVISPALDKIVMKSLAKERGDRYGSGSELYADLLRFMNQAFPKFLPTDLSKFLRTLFAEDIQEERKRREKMAAEAPARITMPGGRPAPVEAAQPARTAVRAPREEATSVDEELKTQLSSASQSGVFVLDGPAPIKADPPEGKTKVDAPANDAPFEQQASGLSQPEFVLPDPVSVKSDMQGAPINNESETRVTAEHSPNDLPPPSQGDVEFATSIQNAPSSLSISMPTAPRGSGDKALMIDIADHPPGYQHARPSPVRPIQSLGRPQEKKSKGRVLLYGVALAVLAAFLVLKKDEVPGGEQKVAEQRAAEQGVVPSTAGVEENRLPASASTAVASAPESAPVAATPMPAPVPAPSSTPELAPSAPVSAVPVVEDTAPSRKVSSNESGDQGAHGPMGYLTVIAAPRATEVVLNGKPLVGRDGVPLQTPVTRFAVPAGDNQHLKLRNPIFGVEWEGTIKIEADRILSLTPTLK
ncbi:MAG: protein kinase [Bdellovibrionales bacterium]|nr:protein kinase [Bdellovibrionales bacterium]